MCNSSDNFVHIYLDLVHILYFIAAVRQTKIPYCVLLQAHNTACLKHLELHNDVFYRKAKHISHAVPQHTLDADSSLKFSSIAIPKYLEVLVLIKGRSFIINSKFSETDF